jgi:hypothetical protein
VKSLAIIALALSIALPAAPARPACSEVQSATAVLDGQYYAVACPQGSLTVSARAGQPAPALGPARITSTTVRRVTVYTLVAGGERYGVQR